MAPGSNDSEVEVTVRRGRGRPTEPVPKELGDSVLDWIAQGKTLADWCRIDGHPCREVIDSWRQKSYEFDRQYAKARELGFDVIAEQLLTIADSTPDIDVRHRQLQIDTRKWLLARWSPRKYGDRLSLAGDKDSPLRVSDVEAARQIDAILAIAELRRLGSTSTSTGTEPQRLLDSTSSCEGTDEGTVQ